MYRMCEAYANGSISGSIYNLAMSKHNDVMITLMLGEVAGGAFGRAGAAIGGKSDSEGKAQASLLDEALQAANKAAKDLDDAKETEKKAEEKVEDKKEIAAKDETESEEKKEANNEEVDKAEGELAAAKEDVRRKRDAKNSADAKARAEITKVVGAGSIAAKPSVGIAQSLAKLQDSYLREDFVDEYIAACIVEMGLAPASSLEHIEQESLYAAQTRAFLRAGFRDSANPEKVTPNLLENTRKVAKGYVEFVQDINTAERTTLFARHCNDNLEKFVIYARSSDLTLEQERIRLDFQRALQEGEATRRASLEAFAAAMKICGGIGDAESQKKCAEAASTIVTLPGGTVELGAVTKVEVPTGEPPLPLAAYDAAKKFKGAFDNQYNKLASIPIAAIPATTDVTEADHAALVKKHGSLSAQRTALTNATDKNSAESLKQLAATEITGSTRTDIVSEQGKRPALRSAMKTARSKSKLELQRAQKALELHDANAKLTQQKYEKLADRINSMTEAVVSHIKAVKAYEDAIKTAKKKKAGN